MLASIYVERCSECSGRVADMGDELVCTSCGGVVPKEILESHERREPQAVDYTEHALGSYLGPMEYGYAEIFSKGFSKSSSTFGYLKTLSDYSCRENGSVYACAKLIERICEKVLIPKFVIAQAMSIAKSMLEMRKERGEFNTASISAFSIITACKIHGQTNLGVREVIEAHRALGYRVKTSTIIRMSIESPVKLRPRRAEEYLSRVVSKLPLNENLGMNLRESGMNEIAYHHKLLETAKMILSMIDESARGGHSPCALAASSVYAAETVVARMSSRRRFMTQRDVAMCVGVAEYTVREQFGEIFRPRIEGIFNAIIASVQPERSSSNQNSLRLLEQSPPTR